MIDGVNRQTGHRMADKLRKEIIGILNMDANLAPISGSKIADSVSDFFFAECEEMGVIRERGQQRPPLR